MKLSIKWKGSLIKSFECDASNSISEIKQQIHSSTNVEPKNQKVMFKGKILKNDQTLASYGIIDGSPLMMMGTPSSSIPKTDEAVQKSLENAKKIKLDNSNSKSTGSIPRGIYNLGNTCYLNSSLQSLLAIPEVRNAILNEEPKTMTPLSKSIKDFLNLTIKMDHDMENNVQNSSDPHEAIKPIGLLLSLHSQFPQFAGKSSSGMLMQHDAEECFSLLLQTLSQSYPSIGELFQISLQSTLSVSDDGTVSGSGGDSASDKSESDDEKKLIEKEKEKVVKRDEIFKIPCHISNNTTDLKTGISQSMVEIITKEDSKGISKPFKKETKIINEPAFLATNFMRFFWKPKEQVKAKILKQVTFPFLLDIDSLTLDGKDVKYELISVLTHIGRSSDSGHYMSWVRQKDSKIWWKCDDDKVVPVGEDEVKKLDGGGDWHTAYLCIYRRI